MKSKKEILRGSGGRPQSHLADSSKVASPKTNNNSKDSANRKGGGGRKRTGFFSDDVNDDSGVSRDDEWDDDGDGFGAFPEDDKEFDDGKFEPSINNEKGTTSDDWGGFQDDSTSFPQWDDGSDPGGMDGDVWPGLPSDGESDPSMDGDAGGSGVVDGNNSNKGGISPSGSGSPGVGNGSGPLGVVKPGSPIGGKGQPGRGSVVPTQAGQTNSIPASTAPAKANGILKQQPDSVATSTNGGSGLAFFTSSPSPAVGNVGLASDNAGSNSVTPFTSTLGFVAIITSAVIVVLLAAIAAIFLLRKQQSKKRDSETTPIMDGPSRLTIGRGGGGWFGRTMKHSASDASSDVVTPIGSTQVETIVALQSSSGKLPFGTLVGSKHEHSLPALPKVGPSEPLSPNLVVSPPTLPQAPIVAVFASPTSGAEPFSLNDKTAETQPLAHQESYESDDEPLHRKQSFENVELAPPGLEVFSFERERQSSVKSKSSSVVTYDAYDASAFGAENVTYVEEVSGEPVQERN